MLVLLHLFQILFYSPIGLKKVAARYVYERCCLYPSLQLEVPFSALSNVAFKSIELEICQAQ